jgi:hypothetical protein
LRCSFFTVSVHCLAVCPTFWPICSFASFPIYRESSCGCHFKTPALFERVSYWMIPSAFVPAYVSEDVSVFLCFRLSPIHLFTLGCLFVSSVLKTLPVSILILSAGSVSVRSGVVPWRLRSKRIATSRRNGSQSFHAPSAMSAMFVLREPLCILLWF